MFWSFIMASIEDWDSYSVKTPELSPKSFQACRVLGVHPSELKYKPSASETPASHIQFSNQENTRLSKIQKIKDHKSNQLSYQVSPRNLSPSRHSFSNPVTEPAVSPVPFQTKPETHILSPQKLVQIEESLGKPKTQSVNERIKEIQHRKELQLSQRYKEYQEKQLKAEEQRLYQKAAEEIRKAEAREKALAKAAHIHQVQIANQQKQTQKELAIKESQRISQEKFNRMMAQKQAKLEYKKQLAFEKQLKIQKAIKENEIVQEQKAENILSRRSQKDFQAQKNVNEKHLTLQAKINIESQVENLKHRTQQQIKRKQAERSQLLENIKQKAPRLKANQEELRLKELFEEVRKQLESR